MYKRQQLVRAAAAGMHFLRGVIRYSRLARVTNRDIRNELGMCLVLKLIQKEKNKWKQHVARITERKISEGRLANGQKVGRS